MTQNPISWKKSTAPSSLFLRYFQTFLNAISRGVWRIFLVYNLAAASISKYLLPSTSCFFSSDKNYLCAKKWNSSNLSLDAWTGCLGSIDSKSSTHPKNFIPSSTFTAFLCIFPGSLSCLSNSSSIFLE